MQCIDIKGVGGVLGLRSGVYIKPEGYGFDFIWLHEKASYIRNDKSLDDNEGFVLKIKLIVEYKGTYHHQARQNVI
jgi:hypothetical protein